MVKLDIELNFFSEVPQYIVCPPTLLNIWSTLVLKLWAMFSKKSTASEFHFSRKRACSSCLVVVEGSRYSDFFRMAPKYSTGLKAGEFPGHTPFPQTVLKSVYKIVIVDFAVCAGTPSCRKRMFFSAAEYSTTHGLQTNWQNVFLVIRSINCLTLYYEATLRNATSVEATGC